MTFYDLTFNPHAIMQGGWDGFVAAGSQMMANVVSFICEMGMVAAVFMILIGFIIHFTGYGKSGLRWLIDGIIIMIGVSCLYMAILGTSGPPDISLWFRPPDQV